MYNRKMNSCNSIKIRVISGMKIFKEIFARVLALWGILMFVITMLLFLIPFFLFCYFKPEPVKNKSLRYLFACLDECILFSHRLFIKNKRQGKF